MPKLQKRFKFTNTRISALPSNPPNAAATDLEFSDSEVTGLKCLSGKSGSKRFLFRYVIHSRKRSLGLGRFPDIDVAAARKAARGYRAMLAEGKDPKQDEEAVSSMPTVSTFFWNTYIPLQKKRVRSWKKDTQCFRRHCEPTIGHLPYDKLKAMHVQAIQLAMNASSKDRPAYANATCNRITAMLKTMGQLAHRLDIVPVNEAMKIRLLQEKNARTRFLDADEMKAFVRAARVYPNPSTGGLLILLALTGARFTEIRTAKYEYLDRENRTLFIPHTKNGKSRVVYLSNLALSAIAAIPRLAGNPYIFTGLKAGRCISCCRTAFYVILEAAGIENAGDVVIHTLRHSVASNLVSSGFSLYDVKAQLAHESIESTQRYAKLTVDRQRQTSEQISNIVSDL